MALLAMQYTIRLPADYDISQIHERVNQRSLLFDALPGLAHKSFLLSENEKIYAPFYIWDNVGEARRFLLDDLFKGVISTFNRPRVRTWMVLDQGIGNQEMVPTFAQIEADTIPPEENLEVMYRREREHMLAQLSNPNLSYYAIALDSDRWELIRYSLWKNRHAASRPSADVTQTYDVLHVSTPHSKD
jgi:hypothetical protein